MVAPYIAVVNSSVYVADSIFNSSTRCSSLNQAKDTMLYYTAIGCGAGVVSLSQIFIYNCLFFEKEQFSIEKSRNITIQLSDFNGPITVDNNTTNINMLDNFLQSNARQNSLVSIAGKLGNITGNTFLVGIINIFIQ